MISRIGTIEGVQDRLRGAVSEIGIHYRSSSIVREAAPNGRLHAGDRAPDCRAEDETGTRFRMFELFKEPLHTVLAVRPPPGADLERLAQVLANYRDVMQGSVLLEGDEAFFRDYAPRAGMLYAVRPDGYIGFRGTCDDFGALEAWAGELFVKPEERT